MKIKTLISIIIIVLCFASNNEVHAQATIHISPSTGSVMAAVSLDNENHMAGYGGAWVHEQVSMVWMTSDGDAKTSSGLLRDHANNIAEKDDKFVICGGQAYDGYFALALPKGYKFTSYKMVLTNDVTTGSDGDFTNSLGSGTYTMRETDASFAIDKASISLGSHNESDHTEHILQRTSVDEDDMTNILYFRLQRGSSGSYVAAYVKSFEITFECANPFQEVLRPASAIADGVDCTNISVQTGRIDIGEIKWQKGAGDKGEYSFKYNYGNVEDLTADFTLYNEGGIVDGTAVPGTITEGKIEADDNYFFLNNDTYYIETPTDAKDQGGKDRPLGYRITAAKLYYDYDHGYAVDDPLQLGNKMYITDGNGNYLNSSLLFVAEPVVWNSDTDGKVWTDDDVYLKVTRSGEWWSYTYTLETGTKGEGSTFALGNNRLYYQASGMFGTTDYYLSISSGNASLSTSSTVAATIENTSSSKDVPSSPYTLSLYDKTGKDIAQTILVNEGRGYLEITGLNNDAIKFEVSGLESDARARIYAELTLEPLNPYVTNMDIVATTPDGKRTIMRQYSTDDFKIANGSVDFVVPNNFANKGGEKVPFHFENLAKHNADDTYGHLNVSDQNGNSRYHFVNSEYYNIIGENLQTHRTEAADYDYTKKIRVDQTGDQPFKANNSDLFKLGAGQSDWTGYYEKYRYSDTQYQKIQRARFVPVELADGESMPVFLMVCDETRYNIAPTTTPRHAFYTYYSTDIKMSQKDYEPVLKYTKIYDSAMLATGFDENEFYGVEAMTTPVLQEGETDDGSTGYLLADQIKTQIEADCDGKNGYPIDAKHILYIDASKLTSIPQDKQEGKTAVTISDLRDMIGYNAVVYLPQNTTASTDNIATQSESGDFVANANITLVDKHPFYAPYDIRVDASNYTEYTRGLTISTKNKQYASVVVPFSVAIDNDGTHVNRDGGDLYSLTFHNMQLTNALSNPEKYNNYDYKVDGHFLPVTGKTQTEPNKPYLVSFEAETEKTDVVFMIQQYGANIHKTPDTKNYISDIEGETATGSVEGITGTVTFTNHGTLNGVLLPKENGYFYFTQDRFVSSLNLSSGYKHVYVMPFRTYYDHLANSRSLRYMNISLDENTETTGITDITAAGRDNGLIISAASGAITVTALRNTTVDVQAVNGQKMAGCVMGEGDTRTFCLPAGIYIVNGRKIAIRN